MENQNSKFDLEAVWYYKILDNSCKKAKGLATSLSLSLSTNTDTKCLHSFILLSGFGKVSCFNDTLISYKEETVKSTKMTEVNNGKTMGNDCHTAPSQEVTSLIQYQSLRQATRNISIHLKTKLFPFVNSNKYCWVGKIWGFPISLGRVLIKWSDISTPSCWWRI